MIIFPLAKDAKLFQIGASNFNSGKVNIEALSPKATTLTSSSGSVDISDNFIVAMRGRRIDIDGEQSGFNN